MARKAFLLRIDPDLLAGIQQWAEDELRSLNGQIEYLLRQALLKRGKKVPEKPRQPPSSSTGEEK